MARAAGERAVTAPDPSQHPGLLLLCLLGLCLMLEKGGGQWQHGDRHQGHRLVTLHSICLVTQQEERSGQSHWWIESSHSHEGRDPVSQECGYAPTYPLW